LQLLSAKWVGSGRNTYVLQEVVRNLAELAPTASAEWARLRPSLLLMDDVLTLDRPAVFHPAKDRPILFGALAWADVLLTLDRGDFGRVMGKSFYGLRVANLAHGAPEPELPVLKNSHSLQPAVVQWVATCNLGEVHGGRTHICIVTEPVRQKPRACALGRARGAPRQFRPFPGDATGLAPRRSSGNGGRSGTSFRRAPTGGQITMPTPPLVCIHTFSKSSLNHCRR